MYLNYLRNLVISSLSPIELFYDCLREPNSKVGLARFSKVRIPKSDVFYAFFLCKERFPELLAGMSVVEFESKYFMKEFPTYV